MLERVEHLQEESAVQVHRTGYVAEHDELGPTEGALPAREPDRVAARCERQSYDAPRVEPSTAASLTPPAAPLIAQSPDDHRRDLLQLGEVIARVVTEVLRRGRVARARCSE